MRNIITFLGVSTKMDQKVDQLKVHLDAKLASQKESNLNLKNVNLRTKCFRIICSIKAFKYRFSEKS